MCRSLAKTRPWYQQNEEAEGSAKLQPSNSFAPAASERCCIHPTEMVCLGLPARLRSPHSSILCFSLTVTCLFHSCMHVDAEDVADLVSDLVPRTAQTVAHSHCSTLTISLGLHPLLQSPADFRNNAKCKITCMSFLRTYQMFS